jgi:hypothetical protein
MTRSKYRVTGLVFRVLALTLAFGVLILPGLSMISSRWSDIGLVVAVAVILGSIFLSVVLPKLKWVGAAFAAIMIAVPPYPYWLGWDAVKGWRLHFFQGFGLSWMDVGVFAAIFIAAMLAFSVIFWAIGRRSV